MWFLPHSGPATGHREKIVFKFFFKNEYIKSQDPSAFKASNQFLKFRSQPKLYQLTRDELKGFCRGQFFMSLKIENKSSKKKTYKNVVFFMKGN